MVLLPWPRQRVPMLKNNIFFIHLQPTSASTQPKSSHERTIVTYTQPTYPQDWLSVALAQPTSLHDWNSIAFTKAMSPHERNIVASSRSTSPHDWDAITSTQAASSFDWNQDASTQPTSSYDRNIVVFSTWLKSSPPRQVKPHGHCKDCNQTTTYNHRDEITCFHC